MLDSNPCNIKRCVLFHIFNDREEGGRVVGWLAWVGESSFLQHMPSVKVVVVLVDSEVFGDCLCQEGMDEHCHGSHSDVENPQTS